MDSGRSSVHSALGRSGLENGQIQGVDSRLMPVPLTIERYYQFIAGIDERTSPLIKGKATLHTATNVDFYIIGSARKRNGFTRRVNAQVSASNAITGLFEYRQRGGSNFFVITSGATIQHDNSGTYTDITGAVTITS